MSARRERLQDWDRRLVRIVGSVRLLSILSWDDSVRTHWQQHGHLPAIELRVPELHAEREALVALAGEIDTHDPLGRFLSETARSYIDQIDLLAAQGEPLFTALSKRLFGAPTDRVHPGAPSHLEAALHFLDVTAQLQIPDPPLDMDAHQAQDWLQRALAEFPNPLPVQVSKKISAKATAGSARIRLRHDARFNVQILEQLLEHEAHVHSATKRNGQDQPVLSAMGLSSPRTTRDQEGLATFAELITDTMDHRRLRRVAVRVLAVQAALEGAGFAEVVELFRVHGQDEEECYLSAARIFRGGAATGGVVFTKDCAYLAGLVRVHTFLVEAFRAGRMQLPRRLFAGRWTLGDARDLEHAFEQGLILEPARLPTWANRPGALAAHLAWAGFQNLGLLPGTMLEEL